jgi:hypothetical protein
MTTDRKSQANRNNSRKSTGPKSEVGKALVACNPVKHGIFADTPVIPGVESEDQWQKHHDGILASIQPMGILETRLAERIASLLWRLNRVTRFETGIVRVGFTQPEPQKPQEPDPFHFRSFSNASGDESELEKKEKKLAKKRRLLAEIEDGLATVKAFSDLPENAPVNPDAVFRIFEAAYHEVLESDSVPWVEDQEFLDLFKFPPEDDFYQANWTAGYVRQGLGHYAQQGGIPLEKLIARTISALEKSQQNDRAEIQALNDEREAIRQREMAWQERKQVRLILPDENAELRVIRYESHLSRLLTQTLHELERIQANRAGRPVPPPVAVDVAVEVAHTLEGAGG